jgi:hypothetical protein
MNIKNIYSFKKEKIKKIMDNNIKLNKNQK